MKKNWVLLIGVIIIISIIKIINRSYFDAWSGIGLYVSIFLGILAIVAFYFLIIRELPRTKNEAKKFKYEGVFSPIWGALIFFVISILWIVGYMVEKLPLAMPIISGVITFIFLFLWIKVRKSGR